MTHGGGNTRRGADASRILGATAAPYGPKGTFPDNSRAQSEKKVSRAPETATTPGSKVEDGGVSTALRTTSPRFRNSPAAVAAAVDEIHRDGATVLRGLLEPRVVRRWAKAFDQLWARRLSSPHGLAPRGPGRYYTTLPWIGPFADAAVYANDVILAVVEGVLGPHHVLVQLAADTPVLGSEHQEMHRDFPPLFGDGVSTPLYALAVNFALCPVREENGPFRMARGTHLLPRAEADDAVATGRIATESVHMDLGDVMIRTPFQLHAGSPNLTDRPRPMVVMGYVCNWLRTDNVSLEVPRGYYESLDDRTRRLLRANVVDVLDERPETYVHFKH